MTNINRTIAKLRYWIKVHPDARKAHASKMATQRWANKTPEEKKAHSDKMVAARQKKRQEKLSPPHILDTPQDKSTMKE